MSKPAFRKYWAEWLDEDARVSEADFMLRVRWPLLHLLRQLCAAGRSSEDAVRVLEVGCGTALNSLWLADNADSASVYAIDILEEALLVAKGMQRLFSGHPVFSVNDARQMSFKDRVFDLVFSHGTLEHFTDPVPVLAEQARVLKNSGFLVVCVPQRYTPFTVYKHISMMLGRWPCGWETEYSLKRLQQVGRSSGLRMIDYDGFGFFGKKVASKLGRARPALSFLERSFDFAYDRVGHGLGKRGRSYLCTSLIGVFQKDST